MRLVRLERLPQRLAFAQQMRLAHHLVDGFRAQALGERRDGFGGEKVGHAVILAEAEVEGLEGCAASARLAPKEEKMRGFLYEVGHTMSRRCRGSMETFCPATNLNE